MNKSMRQLTQFAACAIAALSVVACSSEDSAQQDNAKQNTTKGVATFDGSQPSNDTRALTRTTATYTLGGDAKVFWSSADKIFVQDDANTFHQSNAANLYNPSNKAKATFSLASGSFTLNNREVRYTGENGTDANTVTIATTQTQTTANDFSHLGTSGDCGTATATGSNGNYTFTLNHKASYLCFVPRCMNTDLGPNIKLTKIKVTADQPIAGKYDFSTGSLAQKAGETYSNTVTLNTSDFSLNTTTSSLATNGAYMVVAPGTYNFTITYTIKDPATNVEGDIVKTIASYNCQEGKINDITANLTPKDYSNEFAKNYYMWDAQTNYWSGHNWKDSDPWQPVAPNQPNNNYPKPGDPRYKSTVAEYNGTTPTPYTATQSCANLPTVNAMLWFVMKGDPHWDDSLWSLMGHLGKGGMWIKKRAKIISDEGISSQIFDEKYPDPDNSNVLTDWRYKTTWPWTKFENHNISSVSTLNAVSDYFFLPTIGFYDNAQLYSIGIKGLYWSSTSSPWYSSGGYALGVQEEMTVVAPSYRTWGFQVQPALFQ